MSQRRARLDNQQANSIAPLICALAGTGDFLRVDYCPASNIGHLNDQRGTSPTPAKEAKFIGAEIGRARSSAISIVYCALMNSAGLKN